jgi:hypothetical protein
MSGPGSAVYVDIRFFFDEDGTYLGLARSAKTTATTSGTYELREGNIVLKDAGGRMRTWSASFDERRLMLRDGPALLVLERVP